MSASPRSALLAPEDCREGKRRLRRQQPCGDAYPMYTLKGIVLFSSLSQTDASLKLGRGWGVEGGGRRQLPTCSIPAVPSPCSVVLTDALYMKCPKLARSPTARRFHPTLFAPGSVHRRTLPFGSLSFETFPLQPGRYPISETIIQNQTLFLSFSSKCWPTVTFSCFAIAGRLWQFLFWSCSQ